MRSKDLLREIAHKLDILDLHLTIRDPGTARSADAYDGLRKQLAQAAKGRRAHLTHLVQLDDALRVSDDLEAIRGKLAEMMEQAGVIRIADVSLTEAFEVIEGSGTRLEMVSPAYVDADGGLIRRGTARALEDEPQDEPRTPDDELQTKTDIEPTAAEERAQT